MVAPGPLGELLRRSPGPRRAPGRARAGCRSPPRRRTRWRRGRRRTCPRNSMTLSWSIVLRRFPSWSEASVRRDCRGTCACCRRADTTRHAVARRWDDVDEPDPHSGWRCSDRCGWRSTAVRRGARAEAAGGARPAWRSPRAGRSASTDLVDALWPGDVQESGRQALHTHVSRLRTHLGPAAVRLQTRHGGYRLDLAADGLDLAQARAAARRARATTTRPAPC